MENKLEKTETKRSIINDENLFRYIWFKPTETLRYIVENCPEKHVSLLLVLGGIVNVIGKASSKNMGDTMSTTSVLAICIIFGALFGWISYFIYAWGLSATGKWLNGNSESSEFKTLIAWALIPSICTLILLIPEPIILGDDLFKSQKLNHSSLNNTSLIFFGVLEIILGVWSIVLLVKGISLIQNFGIGKSILNCSLPVLVVFIPLVFLGFLFSYFN